MLLPAEVLCGGPDAVLVARRACRVRGASSFTEWLHVQVQTPNGEAAILVVSMPADPRDRSIMTISSPKEI